MQATLSPISTTSPRLKKFIRQPDRLASRQLTDKGLEAIAIIERYRFIPSSLLVRLMPGGQRNNYRHLQTLFHKGLVQRFALPKYGGPGEFIYYLDSKATLELLIENGLLPPEQKPYREEIIRYNREKGYSNIHRDPDMQGTLLYMQHELMVTRFHWLLEMACSKMTGKVQLEQWKQGPELWNKIEVPKTRPLRNDDATGQTIWEDLSEPRTLPHRPDAFFTLYFPTKPEGQQRSHFMYEADRTTENTPRFKLKLRAHYHFIVKKTLHRTTPCYNVHSIRAVLVESTSASWAQRLRESARENLVSPKPSPLFWFTTSELFTKPQPITRNGRPQQQPLYLDHPETVFKRIWATPVEDKFLNLAD